MRQSKTADELAKFLQLSDTLCQPSLLVRCRGNGQYWACETIVDKPEMHFRRDDVILPLIAEFSKTTEQSFDFFMLLSDSIYLRRHAVKPFLAYIRDVPFLRCDQKADDLVSMAAHLIPDYAVLDPGYEHEFDAVIERSKQIAFCERQGKIAWRGRISGQGYPDAHNYNRFPRYHLLALSHQYPQLLYARLTDDSNLTGTSGKEALRQNVETLVGPVEAPWPAQKFVDYKYLISLEGAVAAWKRVPTILASGSVLMLQTDWQQEFYPRLKAWHNYVPVSRDLSDLFAVRDRLESAPKVAEQIGIEGQNLAQIYLTHASFKQRFVKTLSNISCPNRKGR